MSEEQRKKRGKTYGIFGPMFAGKSEELMRRARRSEVSENSFVIIKPRCDSRSPPDTIESHNKNCMKALSTETLLDIKDDDLDVGFIYIDEGQFFPDLIDFCRKMEEKGKRIHVAMLDATFEGKPFPGTEGIHALCYEYVKIHAVCMNCKNKPAHLTKRIGDSTSIREVGGKDKYLAVCGTCFYLDE